MRGLIVRGTRIAGLVLAMLLVGGISFRAISQEPVAHTAQVYVTTQYNAVLREGPGVAFAEIAIIPFNTTLPVTGRTWNADWFQVVYGEQTGWVAYWLLIWTGDILQLPVEGEIIQTPVLAREAGPVIGITPETLVYRDSVAPVNRVDLGLRQAVFVEMTGRVGSEESGYFWIQFSYKGELYWTASWEVGTPRGYGATPDGANRYAYGRLLIQMRQEISRSGAILSSVAGRWSDLDAGLNTTCNTIPNDASFDAGSFASDDVMLEQIFLPSIRALEAAIVSMNQALALFREVCTREGENRFVSAEEVQAALVFVRDANRNITLARTLIPPLARRDPVLGNR